MQEKHEINRSDENRIEQDLAKLFNYPAVGELFSGNDSHRLDEFCAKLNSTRDKLESIIRYGNKAEAESASRAVKSIEVTLDFLKTLQNMRLSRQK